MYNLTRQASLGDVEAKTSLYEIFSKYGEEFECWTKKLSNYQKSWVDLEDMRQDIYIESVDYHIKNHKHYNLAISDDYLIKKSIKQTIWQYVNKQTTTNGVCLTEPHICLEPEKTGAGQPVRFKTESTSIDFEPSKGNDNTGFPLKESIPDPSMKDPLDNLIYEEFVEFMFEKIKEYQPKYSYDLRKILTLLLEGETSTNICKIMGISASRNKDSAIKYIKRIKVNVFLPLALSIIDDERYTDKYWKVLNKKAKSVFFSQKNT